MTESGVFDFFQGTGRCGRPHDVPPRLPDPPSWRPGRPGGDVPPEHSDDSIDDESFAVLDPDGEAVEMVNAALILRRPLLVTGHAGTGKSTLARIVARELGLGPVLTWQITSSTSLQNGQHHYDAIGRLHQLNLDELHRRRSAPDGHLFASDGRPPAPVASPEPSGGAASGDDLGRFITLGPLGTALLPWDRPRVLLLDEIDKCDIDLPGDLLHVFESGRFTIPELRRETDGPVDVRTADDETKRLVGGTVQCTQFPLIVLTSNEQRDFPPAFLRRCLRLQLDPPSREQLWQIIEARLPGALEEARTVIEELMREYLSRRDDSGQYIATDQLLNAIRVICGLGLDPNGRHFRRMLDNLYEPIA